MVTLWLAAANLHLCSLDLDRQFSGAMEQNRSLIAHK
jgi:hypothetical protein